MKNDISIILSLDSNSHVEKFRTIETDGVSYSIESIEDTLGFDETTVVQLSISFGVGVLSGVVANAVYQAAGTAIKSLIVNNQRIRPSREELEKAIDTIRRSIDVEE